MRPRAPTTRRSVVVVELLMLSLSSLSVIITFTPRPRSRRTGHCVTEAVFRQRRVLRCGSTQGSSQSSALRAIRNEGNGSTDFPNNPLPIFRNHTRLLVCYEKNANRSVDFSGRETHWHSVKMKSRTVCTVYFKFRTNSF